MALPVALKAAQAARSAWDKRETLGPLLLVPVLFATSAIIVPGAFVGFAATTAGMAEQVCLTSARTPDDADGVRRAARRRGVEAPAAAVLSAFASAAQAQHSSDSLAFAGPYRLPAEYAAGEPHSEGRWLGPTEPAGEVATRDSRRSLGASTRAVMRKLSRTDARTWSELRTAPTTTNPDDVQALTDSAQALVAAAFDHVSLDGDTIYQAILAAAVVDSGGYGDQITGGALLIGDGEQVNSARETIGPRAFGGAVRARATTPDPATITTGRDRALAAQEGVVLAFAELAPTSEQREDLQDATNADVIWVVPGQLADGIYPSLEAALAYLRTLTGATAPVALCEEVLLGDQIPLDLAAIRAPDGGAFAAIAYAQSMIGRPYSMSARPPASWDCSKLTAAAWARAGVQLTAYSYSQWNQTTRIPASMVAPGDLAFWFGTDGASGGHVALVDAVDPDGTVWITEAANPTDGVRRRALGGSWDAAYFTGFGRVQRTENTPSPEGLAI